MPRQREVKPWTIYPPTQEDREIIERKAAEVSLSVSAYLCMVGKLANIVVSVPTEQQPAQAAQKKTSKEDDLGAIFEEIEVAKEAEDAANPTDLKPFMNILGITTEIPPVEPEPTQKKSFQLFDMQGEPLSEAEEKFVLKERAAGRTGKVFLSEDEDPYHNRRVHYCTANDFKFEVVPTKEV